MYRRSKTTAWRRGLALVFSLGLLAAGWLTGAAQSPKHNLAAQKLKNPEPNDAATLEAGQKLYRRHCASCHGPQAKGDGGMSLSGGTPSDLTDDQWDYGATDGEIFVAIRDGVSADMLAYKDKLSEKEIWQVVHFLRSLGPKGKEAQ
jgi:cbb3-type cytochrome c oxidase subunit III